MKTITIRPTRKKLNGYRAFTVNDTNVLDNVELRDVLTITSGDFVLNLEITLKGEINLWCFNYNHYFRKTWSGEQINFTAIKKEIRK